MAESVLHVENVTMQFGGVVAVNNLSMDIYEGEIVALIGPNGAGKTTAFNCITGVYEPTNGKVEFCGKTIVENHPQGKMKKLYAGDSKELYPHVVSHTPDYPLSYPVIFDWEDIQADARTDGMDSVQLTKNAIAFCGAVEKAGYRAGVDFNQRFGYEEFDLESLQDYVFWLAEYNETPSFSYHFQLWQYCNDGRVDGIQTDVDLNLAFLRAKH